jgi:hypothetical protein
MSDNAISIYEPTNIEQSQWVAETISKSGLAPSEMNSPQKLLVSMMHGASLGLSAMQSIQNIHVIKGKPTLSADLMGAIVRQSAACEYLRETEATPTRVTMTAARADDPSHEYSRTWTMEDAKRANLGNSGTWKAYPRQMLRARCLSEICRAVFPEVVGGFYVPGEVEQSAPERQTVSTPEAATSGRAVQTIEAEPTVIDVTPDEGIAPALTPFASDILDRVEILQSSGVRHADDAADKILRVGRDGGTEDEQREKLAKIVNWIEVHEKKAAEAVEELSR